MTFEIGATIVAVLFIAFFVREFARGSVGRIGTRPRKDRRPDD
jgi:hypothetical protein